MKWYEFLKKAGNLPVIDVEILLAGVADTRPVKVQISRWVKSGKLIQVKRGIYLLSKDYRKKEVFEPYLASILMSPSYISLEKALEYHGLIPESVPVYTSVTTKRPAKYVTKAGVFSYRRVKKPLFWGYDSVSVDKQTAFVAFPEKALLDLFYLNGMNIPPAYLKELRLQNTEKIDTARLLVFAKRFKSRGIMTAAKRVVKYITKEAENQKTP